MMATDSTASLRARYRRDGYVHLRGFLGLGDVNSLSRAVERAPERDSEPSPLSVEAMRFRSNLLYGDEAIRAVLSSGPVVALACALRGPNLWVRWDQAVWKGPGAPEFPWHQDNGYTNLEAEHLQLWFALTPMSADNGGLTVCPGGHRHRLDHRWVGQHVEAEPPGPPKVIEAEVGDVVAFSSLLPHHTGANVTADTRLAYVAEFLPLDISDETVRGPHFVVARRGAPSPEFVDLAAGWVHAGADQNPLTGS